MGFSIVFLLSYLLTWRIRIQALRNHVMDVPNERSSHTVPVPRGGGLAIVCCFFLALCWLYISSGLNPALIVALTLGGGCVAAVGYIDDRKDISALIRLIVQIIAAGIAVYFLKLSVWAWFPALFAIVWMTNLYNFMDGIDGLAALQGIFVSLVAGTVLMLTGHVAEGTVGLMLAAAIAGFLMWNLPPARIFMGDVGSGTLGFIFAVWALWTLRGDMLSLPFWLIIMAVFLCDATFTLLRRMWRKERWYAAHRSHAYQHLVQKGYSHRRVTLSILLFNVVLLLPAALLALWQPLSGWVLVVGIFGLCGVLWHTVSKGPD